MYTVITVLLFMALIAGSYNTFRVAGRVAGWRYTNKLGEVGNLLTFLLVCILASILGILAGGVIGGII